jgi:hypothetical protein
VRYEVRVVSSPSGQSSFELELDEHPTAGTYFGQTKMVYEIVRVLADEAVIEVAWRAGPVQAWYGEPPASA